MKKTLAIGSTFASLAEKDMDFALKMLEKQFSKPESNKTNGTEKVSTNGYTSNITGTVDWNKQAQITTGKANDQLIGQVRGNVIAGAGKGQKDKARK